jgi:hypothetical protein
MGAPDGRPKEDPAMNTFTHASTRLAPHRHRVRYAPTREPGLTQPADGGLQLNRRANLRNILIELDWVGVCSYENQASFLGLGKRNRLTDLLRGAEIGDSLARDIEWSMQKRQGWMDEDHRGEKLEA